MGMHVTIFRKDILAGLLFVILAAVFGFQSLDLPMGTSVRMGSGYFPVLLSGLLGFLGVLVTVRGLRDQAAMPSGFPWRGLTFVLLAVCAFAAGIDRLGFLPAVALSVFLAAMASKHSRPVNALLITTILVAFCWLVFIVGLGLPFGLIGPWLGGY